MLLVKVTTSRIMDHFHSGSAAEPMPLIRVLIASLIMVISASGCGPVGGANGRASEHQSTVAFSTSNPHVATASLPPGPVAGPRRAQWIVNWSGGASGNGAYVLSGSSSLTATLDITNNSGSTWHVDYDLYVARPGAAQKTSGGADMSYATVRNGVWDSKMAGANSSYVAVIPAGGHVEVILQWPVKDAQGQAVAPGSYGAIVPVSIDGVPDGYAAASLLVQ
jgi:hypothetical protein